MPTQELRIQQALLHPDFEVRRVALTFYSGSFSPNPAILPLALQAASQYRHAPSELAFLRDAQALPHSEATVRWLVEELSQPRDLADPVEDNYCLLLAQLLAQAPPALLRGEMAELVSFPEELRAPFEERLAMATWDWETAWRALRALWEEGDPDFSFTTPQWDLNDRLLEALARHADQAPFVLEGLEKAYREPDSWAGTMEPCLISIAGRMRLHAAVPLLCARLEAESYQEDLDVQDECLTALPRIGGNPVVTALAKQWDGGSDSFRWAAAEILENIHTPLALSTSLEYFGESADFDLAFTLGHAVLGQCAEEALEPLREFVASLDPEEPESEDLRYHLVATAAIVGQTFPEWDDWHREAVENAWGIVTEPPRRLRNRLRVDYGLEPIDPDWQPSWDDEEGEADDDMMFFPDDDRAFSPEEDAEIATLWKRLREMDPQVLEEFDRQFSEEPKPAWEAIPPRLEPIHRDAPEVGRNDPCPCGSGKKYKKCCLPKQP